MINTDPLIKFFLYLSELQQLHQNKSCFVHTIYMFCSMIYEQMSSIYT